MQAGSQRRGAVWTAALTAAASAATIALIAGCRPAADAPRPLAPLEAASANPAVSATLRKQSDDVLGRHRQMIVLMDGEAALKAADREAVHAVGLLLFHDMQESLRALGGTAAKSADPAGLAALSELLDRIEQEPSWFDADRLAFKEFLTQLTQQFSTSQSIAGLKLAKRAGEDLAVLAEIESAYAQELRDTFGRFAQRGIVPKREKWSDYVAKLKGVYTRDGILKDYATILPDLKARPSVTEDDAAPAGQTAAPAGQTAAPAAATPPTRGPSKQEREFFGRQLPPKTVLLTFDDGPHPRYTDEILEILKRYQAPAVFFELGRNLGSVDAAGKVKPGPGTEVARRVLAAGHPIANHSFSHGVMSKFELAKVRQEASSTEALLDAAGREGQALFRFPYGARNDAALTAIEALKLRSMMWNVDSLDWSDPIPKSIAARVLGELGKQQRGIVLFHDIHARTVEALPLVLDQLKAEGYRFAAWKDGKIVAVDTPAAEAAPDLAGANLYRDSVALVIGIDQYRSWPRLQHAVRDARAIQETLQTQFGFKPENVTTLTDGDATRANILRALNGMARKGDSKLRRDDRVFVFFAGHGSTRKLPSGRDVGYIIPVDAGPDDLQTDAIAMPQLQELSEALPAKHAFFVIDACYSGLGLTRGGAAGGSANFVRDNARRLGRQMMTAGGADQQVADDGPGGHSVFTWTLLQALSGKADLNGDGLITATELAAYVAPAVSAIAHQTPAFGSLPGSEGGEFIFELASAQEQALSGDSNQLDAKASALAKQADEARNAQLQPVAQASSPSGAAPGAAASAAEVQVTLKGLDGNDTAIATSAAPAPISARVAAQRANDRGLQLYKERRYDEAEAAFTEALKLQPKFALAANNLGFIYYKRDKPAEAARWYRKAIEMDGSRALAHLNLGDALLRAGEEVGAQTAYRAFIELSPKHPRAAELKAWIEHPDSARKPEPPR